MLISKITKIKVKYNLDYFDQYANNIFVYCFFIIILKHENYLEY